METGTCPPRRWRALSHCRALFCLVQKLARRDAYDGGGLTLVRVRNKQTQGTKADLRDDAAQVAKLQEQGKYKTHDEFAAAAMAMGAEKYLECSALKQQGLQQVFDEAIRAALKKKAAPGKDDVKSKKKGGGGCGASAAAAHVCENG